MGQACIEYAIVDGKGMRLGMSNVLSNPNTFLEAHRTSDARLARVHQQSSAGAV